MCNYKYKVLVPKYFVSEKDGVEQRFSNTARFPSGAGEFSGCRELSCALPDV